MGQGQSNAVGRDGRHSGPSRPPRSRLAFQAQASVSPSGAFGLGSHDFNKLEDKSLVERYKALKAERSEKRQAGLDAFQTDSCTIYMLLALLLSRTMITSLLESSEEDAYGLNNLFHKCTCLTKWANNIGIAVKSVIVLVLCVLAGTLQLLPIFLVGWYQPGDVEKGYLARIVKGDDEVCLD